MELETVKKVRSLDLALLAARKRQSPRTQMLHLFAGQEEVSDTIPLYENFCFALALFRQKTAEAVQEGKELLYRLFPFQTPEGSFPTYLHEYPRPLDRHLPLKIAPIYHHLLRHFSPILEAPLKEALQKGLQKLIEAASRTDRETPLFPLWKERLLALQGERASPPPLPETAEEFALWTINQQLLDKPAPPLTVPFCPRLEIFFPTFEGDSQERGEPRPTPIEWLLAEEFSPQGITSPRLLKEHLRQIELPLFLHPLPLIPEAELPSHSFHEGRFRLLWGGRSLHTLAAFGVEKVVEAEETFHLTFAPERESSLYTDASEETKVSIGGERGTVFREGEEVWIETPERSLRLSFSIEGGGTFLGHLLKGNRPHQLGSRGAPFEAFDWKIWIRPVRPSEGSRVQVSIK